jgi:hypothetical protein
MEDFQRALEDCCLSDLGFIGPNFTWTNGREGVASTQERLDRAVANSEWCGYFKEVNVSVLARRSSDHNPCIFLFSGRIMEVVGDNEGLGWRRGGNYFHIIRRL